MMRKKLLLAVLSAFLIGDQAVLAWSPSGHESVAYIAYQRLTPRAKERVNQLLKLNPYYDTWLTRISPSADRETQIFMLASIWCDEIKGDHNFVSDGSAGGNNPDSPGADQNIGYSDHNMHKYWHFCDTPFHTDKTPLPPIPQPNAEVKIPEFERTLASSTASDELKSYDLTWLIHLVGDVHQPLHCVTRISADRPRGDDGGNAVKLKGQDSPKDLHTFWDYQLGHADKPDEVIPIAKSLPEPNKKRAAKSDCRVWIKESFKLAKKNVYIPPILKGTGPFELTEEYKQQSNNLCKEQAALGGARLANAINKAFE